jgi:N-acetylglucosamine kinase-like BadF-type ATPase
VNVRFVGEFAMSLYAAIQEEIGGLALAGTGSFACARTRESMHRIGGYGSVLGDEGSGYDIGRRALVACLHMRDGIGPQTAMDIEVTEQLHRLGLRWPTDIYSLPAGQQRSFIASLCPIVGRCAARGDAEAAAILRDAARQLALQMNGVLRKCGGELEDGFPVSIAGGVWKAHPLLYSMFSECVKREHPEVAVVPPLFEPVVGGILLGLKEKGHPVKPDIPRLKQIFAEFIYRLP